jgi:hypothetical protein
MKTASAALIDYLNAAQADPNVELPMSDSSRSGAGATGAG